MTSPTKTAPDFNALRAQRNAAMQEVQDAIAKQWGIRPEAMQSNFNPNSCYCACPGPCEHDWTGPEWRSEDGCASSVTCARCGCTAMSHDLRVLP